MYERIINCYGKSDPLVEAARASWKCHVEDEALDEALESLDDLLALYSDDDCGEAMDAVEDAEKTVLEIWDGVRHDVRRKMQRLGARE